MEIPLLSDITIICALALAVIFICHRLKTPDTVGFLITGILVGPHSLGLIHHISEVEQLAEIGVVCLLFSIGLEFSLQNLMNIRKLVILGGTIQVCVSIVGGIVFATFIGMRIGPSIFFGFLLSLSSTAIVLKILQQRAETGSPHGRLTIGILIYQDVIVVAMTLIAPFLAGKGLMPGSGVLAIILKVVAVSLTALISVKWIVPTFLSRVAALRNQQMFVLGIVMIALGATWLTSSLGLSLALGAFIAGLIVSESEFSERALGNVLPFKDLFTSFFFVSIGMLLDLRFVFSNILVLSFGTIALIAIKFLAAASSALFLRLPIRTAVLTGVALCQIGEFSFVLSETGSSLGLIDRQNYQLFLALSVITMILTPMTVESGNRLVKFVLRLPLPNTLKRGMASPRTVGDLPVVQNHVIIIGFGQGGQNLNLAAMSAAIPRVIVELNPVTVKRERSKGVPIFYGDAAVAPVLKRAGVTAARILVTMIADPGATRRIIELARRINPALYIIARTRFVSEIETLSNLGASEVIAEEYEASIEILVRVLQKYLLPSDDIERFVDQIRSDHYQMFRSSSFLPSTVSDLTHDFSETEIVSIRVPFSISEEGKTLKGLNVRKKFGVTILALKRGPDLIANPSGEEKLIAGDIAIVLGSAKEIRNWASFLNRPES
ncbi:MAG: cation:proton antiporter [Desulfomonilaceae bacterium]